MQSKHNHSEVESRALQRSLRKEKVKNLCFRYRNFSLPFTSPNTFVAMDSPECKYLCIQDIITAQENEFSNQ